MKPHLIQPVIPSQPSVEVSARKTKDSTTSGESPFDGKRRDDECCKSSRTRDLLEPAAGGAGEGRQCHWNFHDSLGKKLRKLDEERALDASTQICSTKCYSSSFKKMKGQVQCTSDISFNYLIQWVLNKTHFWFRAFFPSAKDLVFFIYYILHICSTVYFLHCTHSSNITVEKNVILSSRTLTVTMYICTYDKQNVLKLEQLKFQFDINLILCENHNKCNSEPGISRLFFRLC